jgi:hypothetical protein
VGSIPTGGITHAPVRGFAGATPGATINLKGTIDMLESPIRTLGVSAPPREQTRTRHPDGEREEFLTAD